MNIFENVGELIGKTPLIRLKNTWNTSAVVLGKLECFNPAGSIKDRAALYMINDAEKRGKLAPGATIIEPTSGNTGIGLCLTAAVRGYKVILTMPESMSVERRKLLAAYGAQLVLTPASEGMMGAVKEAQRICAKTPGSFIPDQFSNPANALAHYETTGPEIFADTDGHADILVCGVGTGGTLTGTGMYLKEKLPSIQIAAVEPASSPLLSQGKAGPHGLMGIGANFVPDLLDRSLIDMILTVSDEEAYNEGRHCAREEGIFIGISAAAAVAAAKRLAEKAENAGKTIVAILPDGGDRYLSTKMFSE